LVKIRLSGKNFLKNIWVKGQHIRKYAGLCHFLVSSNKYLLYSLKLILPDNDFKIIPDLRTADKISHRS